MKIRKLIILTMLLISLSCCFVLGCNCNNDDEQNVEIVLNDTNLTLDIFDRYQMTADVIGSQETLTWESTNTDVVKIENGLLIPVNNGKSIIIASCAGVQEECIVTVNDSGARPNIDLGFSETKLFVGNQKTIKPLIEYKGKNYEDFTVEYLTENSSVATIEDNIILGKEKGSAVFTVKYSWRGFEDFTTISIVVKDSVAFGVEKSVVNLSTIAEFDGKTYDVESVIIPHLNVNKTNINDFAVEYEYENNGVIEVDSNGRIISKDFGSSVVKAKCVYDGEEYISNIKVNVDFPTKKTNDRFLINLFGESKLDINVDSQKINGIRLYDANKNLISEEISNGKFSLSLESKSEYEKEKFYIYTEDKVGYEITAEYVTSIIYTKQDLFEMRNTASMTGKAFDGYFVLANDIDFGGDIWTPWCSYYVDGSEKDYSFVGTFDGNGYTISNMTFNYEGSNNYSFKGNGFIGKLGKKGVIKNVSFINCETYSRTGLNGVIVCGQNNGLIENVYVEMPVTNFKVIESAKKVAYIFSIDEFAGRIENCFANITGEKTDSEMIIYGATTMTVNNNVNVVGDVVPVLLKNGSPDNGEVKVYDSISSYNSIANKKYDSTIWNIASEIPLLKNYREIIILETNLADLDLSDASGQTYSIPFNMATPVEVSIFGEKVDFTYSAGKINISKAKIVEIGCGEKRIMISTADKKYIATVTIATKILKTKADIYGFKTLAEANYVDGVVGHYGGYYILGNDITCDGGTPEVTQRFNTSWKFSNEDPFKYGFYGIFDGRGHTISDLYIYNKDGDANTYASGLFGHVVGTVKNLSIKNPSVATTTMNMQGIVCGANSGEIINVSVIFTKDIDYRGTMPSGMDGSIAVFGSYKYYQPETKFGEFNNCKLVLEEDVTNAKDIYFCCKDGTTKHNYTFVNCVAESKGTAEVIISNSKNGTTVTYISSSLDDSHLTKVDKTDKQAYDFDLSVSDAYEFTLDGLSAQDIESIQISNGNSKVNIPFTLNGSKISIANSVIKARPYGDYILKATTNTSVVSYKVSIVTKILRTKADIYGFKALTEANYVDGVEGHYGGYYILGNDITCDGGTNGSDAAHAFISTWKFKNDDPFKYGFYGVFDGRGYTIIIRVMDIIQTPMQVVCLVTL